ncbi:hypothetical protein [Nostoc sp. 'Peltigera membranacea cyanobiont' N6]|uniref:hypothetical protein n=1 Tax=Nostoc sp. 'Peltigera membranacea cyanobiont' N6 TaxID=1261031 RepID=UPI000CF31D9E|nr:hypothetical protein [Nostoc sp. 'Peltigera membranacea cyanobiont' N6]AVH67718.1 hypothetical protein NPM_6323 [Nostoc sp. 'Peltigera membranacea cyanobiont' N6]
MIRTQGKGGISWETASTIDLLSAYVGATLASKNTAKLITALIDDASKVALLIDNHKESVVKSTNEKVVISVDDFQNNPKRVALEVARKGLGLLLAPLKISDFLTDESLKLIKQFIRQVAK